MPYFRQCAPPELKAMLPPMVQTDWLEGSGAKVEAVGGGRLAHVQVDHARLDHGDALLRIERTMRLSRLRAMTRPSLMGSEPPDRLVPLPRATNGTSSGGTAAPSRSPRRVSGITTAAGRTR